MAYYIKLTYLVCLSCCITSLSSQECKDKIDISFLIDSSLSIRENNPQDNSYDNWQLIKDFVSQVTEKIQIGQSASRIAVVKFSSLVDESEVLYLDNSHTYSHVKSHVGSLSFAGGNTNTSGALKFMSNRIFSASRGDREYVDNIAVLLTDGLSNVDQHMTTREALNAKMKGITIFTIGITEYTDGGELQEIASDPADHHHLKLEHFSQLNGAIDLLLGKICTNRPPPETPCRNNKFDLCIVMDSSGSIGDKDPDGAPEHYNWNLMKDFVAAIISSLEVGPTKARISVMIFSGTSQVKFDLDDKTTTSDMVQTVLSFHHLAGGTNTSGALRMMKQQVFKPYAGDRSGVPNVGIIVTDGESTVDRNYTTKEAMAVKQAGIRMFAVGITNQVDFQELDTIASYPSKSHVFYSAELSQVAQVTSRLIWGVCNGVPMCDPTVSTCTPESIKCKATEKLTWIAYPKHLLLGYNHARLQDVDTVEQCKIYCLQDPKCRSIDFIKFAKECSISYVTKEDEPGDFVQDDIAEYHQWMCKVDGSSADDKSNEIPDPGNDMNDNTGNGHSSSGNGNNEQPTGRKTSGASNLNEKSVHVCIFLWCLLVLLFLRSN